MIDIHCHILPRVDDGAEDLAAGLQMARMAAQSGVKAIIATPHCNLPNAPRKNYAGGPVMERFLRFRELVARAEIPVQLFFGAEVLCTGNLERLLRDRKLPTLAGSRYLLAEFSFDEPLEFMEDRLSCIAAFGLVPVIAHPERYEAVQRDPRVIQRWFRRGYVIQLNKGSLLGRLGRRAEATAGLLLDQGLAHAVASDAHSPDLRTPHMEPVRAFLEERCGPEYTGILLRQNPERIIRDLPMLEA